MMQDWNAYRAALKERVGDFASLNPDVLAGFATIEGAAAKTGHLAPKMHELIALAVTTRCDGCISVHTQKTVQYGATREEISEALGGAPLPLTRVRYSSTRRPCSTRMRSYLPCKSCERRWLVQIVPANAFPIFEEYPCSSIQIFRCALQ